MKKLLTILSFAIASVLVCQAQDVRVLSLDDCRSLALDNNAAVRIAQGKAEAAKQVSHEAFTKYFPTVEASWTGFTANKGLLQYDVLNILKIDLIRNGWNLGVTAMQPIFAGGQIVNGNRLAQVGEEAAKLESTEAADEVLVTVEKYYWQLSTLKSKRQTLESVLQMVDSLEHNVSVAVKAGVVLTNDLLKVQLQRNELRSLMVDLDNGIALSKNLLAQYVGFDGRQIDIPVETVDGTVPTFPSDIYVDPASALDNTIDYQLLDKQLRASELKKKIAVGENLPVVAAGAGYFYDELFSQRHSVGALMLTVKVPISSWWGGSHKIKKAAIEAENARLQKDDLSQMIQIGMQNSWDELTAAYRKMQIASESIAQSTENLRLNQKFYEVGVSTITDLLEAQTMYRKSLDQFTEAYGNFRQCRVQYLKASGQSLANP